MPRSLRLLLTLGLCAPGVLAPAARAQTALPAPTLDGALILDYTGYLRPPDTARVGDGGFVLRRGYLGATFTPAPKWTARVRFETDDRTAPAFRAYDLYLRRADALGRGHAVTAGLLPLRAVQATEAAWGYRHLSRTLLNRLDVQDARDLGVEARGPLGGPFAYSAALTNGSDFRRTPRRAGRASGTVEAAPGGALLLAASDVGWDEGAGRVAFGGLAGLTRPGRRVGVEGFWERRTEEDAVVRTGAAAFWALQIAPRWTFAGRADAAWTDGDRALFGVAGVGLRVDDAVEVLPNVVVVQPAPDAPVVVTGRLTAFLRF